MRRQHVRDSPREWSASILQPSEKCEADIATFDLLANPSNGRGDRVCPVKGPNEQAAIGNRDSAHPG